MAQWNALLEDLGLSPRTNITAICNSRKFRALSVAVEPEQPKGLLQFLSSFQYFIQFQIHCTCNPSMGQGALRQEDCCEFKASQLHKKNLSLDK